MMISEPGENAGDSDSEAKHLRAFYKGNFRKFHEFNGCSNNYFLGIETMMAIHRVSHAALWDSLGSKNFRWRRAQIITYIYINMYMYITLRRYV